MLHRREFLNLATTAAALPALSGTVAAQDYPARAVTLIVPYSAGGSADTLPRVIADAHQPRQARHHRKRDGRRRRHQQPDSARRPTATRSGWAPGRRMSSTVAVYSLQYDVQDDFEPIAQIAGQLLRSRRLNTCRRTTSGN